MAGVSLAVVHVQEFSGEDLEGVAREMPVIMHRRQRGPSRSGHADPERLSWQAVEVADELTAGRLDAGRAAIDLLAMV